MQELTLTLIILIFIMNIIFFVLLNKKYNYIIDKMKDHLYSIIYNINKKNNN
jgi:cell shape-determining protein MreC